MKLAVIGSGIMGGIWIERLLNAKAIAHNDIMACDPDEQRLNALHERFSVAVSKHNPEGAAFGEVVLLAPPPAAMAVVLDEIAPVLSPNKTVVSLAAGVSIAAMERRLPANVPVVRVMPNTPSLVGAGINAVAYGSRADSRVREQIDNLLRHLGDSFEITDEQMNTACALCAVGPTYLFPIMEALIEAASTNGLPSELAQGAVASLFAGTGLLMKQTAQPPSALKDMISLRTIDEEAAHQLLKAAFQSALQKLNALEERLSQTQI
jgi:pyrroline-5-carboxylate reductase